MPEPLYFPRPCFAEGFAGSEAPPPKLRSSEEGSREGKLIMESSLWGKDYLRPITAPDAGPSNLIYSAAGCASPCAMPDSMRAFTIATVASTALSCSEADISGVKT
jgi:hypothetical protein